MPLLRKDRKMRKAALLVTAILLTLSGTALGDIVVLKDGSRTEGIVTDLGDRLKVKLDYGHIILPKRLVDHVIVCDTPRQKFEKKLSAIGENDAGELKKLQQWCSENGLKSEAEKLALRIGRLALEKKAGGIDMKSAGGVFDFALWCRRNGYENHVVESYLWKVISIEPDHTAARQMLGYARFRGQWLKEREIARIRQAEYDREMRLKGLVKYNGQWLTPDAASYLKQLEDLQARREELERDRRQLDDDAREQAREREELAALQSSLYLEQNRFNRWEERLERAAFNQVALAQRLAFERNEMARLRREVDELKDELEREKDKLREEREEMDRERSRLRQLRWRLERERRQLHREKSEKKDRRLETESPAKPKNKMGSEEHLPGRRFFPDQNTSQPRRERVRR